MFDYKLPSKKISDKKLAIIKNPVKRLFYLFKKYSYHEHYESNKYQLLGLISMVGGLVYHYEKFCRAEVCAKKNFIKFTNARNEALQKGKSEFTIIRTHSNYDERYEFCAYTNILGQIYYLLISNEFKDIGLPVKEALGSKKELFLKEKAPTFGKYLFIRKKYSAHRKIDYSFRDKSKDLGMNNCGLLFGLAGKAGEFSYNGKLTMYFPNNDNFPVEYCLSNDHDKIIKEIENLFKCLF